MQLSADSLRLARVLLSLRGTPLRVDLPVPDCTVVPSLGDAGWGLDSDLDVDLPATLLSTRLRAEVESHYALALQAGEPLEFLHICDLHIPFHDMRVLNEALEYARMNGIRRCIIDGDLLDLYAVSNFPKFRHIPVNRERHVAEDLLDLICEYFDEVVLNNGNHERRIRAYFAKRIEVEAQDLVELDILQSLASSRPKVRYTGSWWVRIGSVIFAHPSSFSSIPARTVVNVSEHFTARGIRHSACVIGHTHKVVGGVRSRGVMLYESGCQCHDMEYLEDGKIRKEPWARGFGHIVLTPDGHIDAIASRIIPSSYDPPYTADCA